MARTFYQRLRISSNASQEAISAAFKKLALRYHPDKVIHLDEEAQKSALRKMQSISEAFAALRDPSLRELYDRCLRERLDFTVESVGYTGGKLDTVEQAIAEPYVSEYLEKVTRALENLPGFACGDKLGNTGIFNEVIKGRYKRDRCLVHLMHVNRLTVDELDTIACHADSIGDESNAVLSRACHSYVIIADHVDNAAGVRAFIERYNKRASLAARGEPMRALVLIRQGDAVPFIPHGATISPPFILLRLT